MSLENFQREHGEQWSAIIEHPAFGAAMQFLNAQKINAIAQLSDEEIELRGKLILADLRGHLNHENDLIKLSVMKSLEWGHPPAEEYPSAEEEFAEQHPIPKPPEVVQPPIHTPKPKPKKRK